MVHHRESNVDWIHLAFYGAIACVVIVIGGFAIWGFVERQSLVIRPEPLPKITLVASDGAAPLAASWIRLLTRAGLNPNLVALADLDRVEGVVVLCGVEEIPADKARLLEAATALAFVGNPPETPLGGLRLAADRAPSDQAFRVSDIPSPVLARIRPGAAIRTEVAEVALLQETPGMIIDARWDGNARAAVMHMEKNGRRYLWFGVEPDALPALDRELVLILRAGFRWVAGQPVSDGAVGAPQTAKTLAGVAREEARVSRFAFSVDRGSRDGVLTVRMINRAPEPISNPTVMIWLPLGVKSVSLGGDFIMSRNATLTGVPEQGACLLSLPRLARGETRVLKLVMVEPERDGSPQT